MFNDFLNDVFKGPTHLCFYMQCQKLIAQLIFGDHNYKKSHLQNQLREHHIKVEQISELVPRIFTASTLLSIFEQNLQEKQRQHQE